MAVIQDDVRENQQIELFGLTKPKGAGRSGVDAILELESQTIAFELKTTINGSVTTVRDFGYDHIKKWENKHWLISKYSRDGQTLEYSLYGSPQKMSKWITSKKEYIKPDVDLANIVPQKIDIKDLYKIVGKKQSYTLDDARKLNKRQNTVKEYKNLMDLEKGYSPKRMLEILRMRCEYLINRGATLNNPHIPASYFEGWEKITKNHKKRLRELVSEALDDMQ